MKRNAIYIIMVSLLAAAFVSCRMETPVDGDGMATLTLVATVNDCMDSDTKASRDGALTNLAGQGYQLRYMMELWSLNGKTMEMEYKAEPKYIDIYDGMSLSVEYNLSLLAKKYKMVMWADIVKVKEQDGQVVVEEEYYKKGENLSSISIPQKAAFGPDVYDAFTGTGEIDLTSGSKIAGLTLKRPLAKIRIIDDRIDTDPDPKVTYYTSLTFASRAFPEKYNALTRDISSTSTENVLETSACESAFEPGTGLCLFTGYIFAPEKAEGEESDKYGFTIKVTDTNQKVVKEIAVSDITVRRNALTTIKGKIIQ